MSTCAVTGASGHLGRLVVEELLARGVAAADVVAIVRTPDKVADLAERGVRVRTADYSSPETLSAAVRGADVLLLVSGNEVGQRVPQHTAVVEAAKAEGVGRVVYTSVLRATETDLALAPEHAATEEVLRASGVPFTLLRNGWYTENYTDRLEQYLATGEIVGAAGTGRIAAATRQDYAEAAVAVLTGEGHENAVYELGGTPFTLADLARVITEVTGTEVVHRDLTAEDLTQELVAAGLDEDTAGFVVSLDVSTAGGALDTDSDDLATLIGRPPTSLVDAVRAARA
ncbi:SDR family oxidoreductase [Umezawaea beigongshangensis]|uniref:SDR family oxidoreductase n=1 Tax=Umezawaea beigongshangensis TaxID=2780383 RepID=UPI0018F17E77|nr:SDR family oxidoreductase [Umezawaea beigongshangensis]